LPMKLKIAATILAAALIGWGTVLATPTLVGTPQKVGTNNTSPATLTMTGVTAGDTLIAVAANGNGTADELTITDTSSGGPNTWVQRSATGCYQANSGNAEGIQI